MGVYIEEETLDGLGRRLKSRRRIKWMPGVVRPAARVSMPYRWGKGARRMVWPPAPVVRPPAPVVRPPAPSRAMEAKKRQIISLVTRL